MNKITNLGKAQEKSQLFDELELELDTQEKKSATQYSMIDDLRIFIGYDSKEPIATYVCAHSLQKYAKQILPISILRLEKVDDYLTRSRDDNQSTEFAYSRFLVPFLSTYKGYSLFLDSDFLVRADIFDLLQQIDPNKAVSVVKHNYEPKTEKKFLNQKQTRYERKNWSSFMLFNNAKCGVLSPDIVNSSTGLYLHRFKWLADEEIGDIDVSWNYLVGEYPCVPEDQVNALHYTIGGPYFEDYKNTDYAECWFSEYSDMVRPICQRKFKQIRKEN